MLLLSCLFFSALAAPLASPGDRVAGLEVLDVAEHPEFQRISIALSDGRALSIEVTATPEPTGACTHHGLSLSPRWELLGESIELEDQPPVVLALCERLEASGSELSLRPPSGGAQELRTEPDPEFSAALLQQAPDQQVLSQTWLRVPLLGLLLALLISLLGPVRRAVTAMPSAQRRDLLLVAAVGVAARLLLSPRGVFWGPFFGYGRLVEAWGVNAAHPLYGGGFSALLGPISSMLDHSAGAVFGTNLVLSALAPPLMWALVRMLVGEEDRTGALVAGLGLALLPAHVWLAASEAMHVQVATLSLLSMAAAVGFCRTGSGALALVSALSVGFATHIRPEVAPMALVPAGWVLLHARRSSARWVVLAALLIAALVGHRALDIALSEVEPAADYGAAVGSLAFWLTLFVPMPTEAGAGRFTHTFLQLRLTPLLLPLLAGVGLVWSRHRRAVALAVVWWVLTVLPVLPKSWPLADALRLQLPGQQPALLLAGLGAIALTTRLKASWWVAPVAVVVTSLIYLPLVIRPWAVHQEWDFLQETLPELPEGATVLYDDGGVHHTAFGQWMSAAGGARWVGIEQYREDPEPAAPLLAWLGVSCQLRPHDGSEADTVCGILDGACTLRPWKTTAITSRSDVNSVLATEPEPIGFYFVDECSFSAAPSR
jgi:hypothetical protein